MLAHVPAFFHGIVPYINNIRSASLYVGRPVLVSNHQLVPTGYDRRHILYAVDVFFNGFGVIIGKARPAACLDTGTGSRTAAGLYDQQVTAQPGNILFDLFFNPKTKADHGDYGANADNDAQQCQQCTQLVGNHPVNGHLDRFIEHNRVPAFHRCSDVRHALPGYALSAVRYPVRG